MSDQPKPTGEWTKNILDELQKRLPPGYHFGQLVADAHNSALAAEKKHYAAWRLTVNEEHRKQLAAEREKLKNAREIIALRDEQQASDEQLLAYERKINKTLVDALKLLASEGELIDYRAVARTALAKVK